MKRAGPSTLILVTATQIARADFDGPRQTYKSAPRPAADAVRAALALGGKAGAVWVLSEDVFTHDVALSPAQVTGLTAEQLQRALAFEVEPFSGISVAEGAIGFHRRVDGVYDVVEVLRGTRDAIRRGAEEAGGKLAGIGHPSTPPLEEKALEQWFEKMLSLVQSGDIPLITPPAPAPAANRFQVIGAALAGAALVFMLILGSITTIQRRGLESRAAALYAATNELDSVTKQNADLRKQLAVIEKEQALREQVSSRRGALAALLNGLAATHSDDVVLRSIQVDGPSSLIVSGISLEADAVDEMSIVLTQTLRPAGWAAQPRSKTGKRALTNGGPWEFSLTFTQGETSGAKTNHLSQSGTQ